MGNRERVCGLCLKMCSSFESIEGDMKEVLDIVLAQIDLATIQEPVMCTQCTEMLINCFDFKAECLNTHDYLVPFVNNRDGVKLDLKDVYLSKNENGSGVPKDQDVCGFCMGSVKNSSVIFLDVQEGDILRKMIEQCLPELNLNIIEKPVICPGCHGSLQNYFRFMTDCLIIEKKIKKYFATRDKTSRGQMELSELLQFTVRDVTSDVDGISVNVIEPETQFCKERENVDERNISDAEEEIDHQDKSFIDMNYMMFNKEQRQEINKSIKEENCVETCHNSLVNDEIEIKTNEQDLNRFEVGVVLLQPEIIAGIHRSRKCLMPNFKKDLSKPRVKPTSTMYKCDSCSYQAKQKSNLKRHLLLHKAPSEVTMHKCNSCSFQSKLKSSLKRHLLVHKSPSEITMHKCTSCSYRTTQKMYLKQHFLVHKTFSEVKMYKCECCSFQSKFNGSLQKHLLSHKDLSEVTLYKCDSCPYQTKLKGNLKKHFRSHKSPSEVIMYKCDLCSYQSKQKSNLKTHLLGHKYKRDSCSFQYIPKYRLNSQQVLYKCESCSFQTKFGACLKRHLLLHNDPSEVTVYKCDSCSFQTKLKHNLKTHLLVHKSPSEVTMYKCDSCSFQTKYKKCLKTHFLVHKGPSEVAKYKCDYCSYQTRQKGHLNRHLLAHKSPSEVTVYKCDSCSYETRRKDCFKKHLLVHTSRSGVKNVQG